MSKKTSSNIMEISIILFSLAIFIVYFIFVVGKSVNELLNFIDLYGSSPVGFIEKENLNYHINSLILTLMMPITIVSPLVLFITSIIKKENTTIKIFVFIFIFLTNISMFILIFYSNYKTAFILSIISILITIMYVVFYSKKNKIKR